MTLTGETFGNYLMGQVIGSGAMGEVYQAYRDRSDLSAVVAIKVLHPDFAQDAEFRARFEREASLMTALAHPNILPLLEYGSEKGYLYLVLRYVNGQTLARLMVRRAFSPHFTWVILKPLAAALQYGHEQGILHRDVKPGNVLLERVQGELKIYLMDFGLAKKPGVDITLTETGVSIGTPEYMSPEAALGEFIDHRADVYSLAIVAYELLVGVVPFDKGSPYLTALAQVNDPPAPLIKLHPHFPPLLSTVVMQSLAKDPAQRHQSVAEFATEFETALLNLSPAQLEAEYWIK